MGSETDGWWESLSRLFQVCFRPAQIFKATVRKPLVMYTASHVVGLKTILLVVAIYLAAAGRLSGDALLEEVVPQSIAAILLTPVIVGSKVLLLAGIVWAWVRLAGTVIAWPKLIAASILSEVPRLVELLMRVLILVLSVHPDAVPNQVSFGPAFSITDGLLLSLLNPFIYWQSYLLVQNVRDIHPRGWSPVNLAGTVVIALSFVS